jgi:hypothetical protein
MPKILSVRAPQDEQEERWVRKLAASRHPGQTPPDPPHEARARASGFRRTHSWGTPHDKDARPQSERRSSPTPPSPPRGRRPSAPMRL